MTVKIIGAEGLIEALNEIVDNIEDDGLVLDALIRRLNETVPVDTGYLKGSLRRTPWELEYTAPYAGYVEEQQGFAKVAIEKFNFGAYADAIVEPF